MLCVVFNSLSGVARLKKKEWRDSGYGNIAELLETDSPPDAKSIIDEVRILQKDGIEAMKMAVSVLTTVQTLFRAMKPGETRQDMAAKCQKLRAKHGMPLTPKLTMLLSQFLPTTTGKVPAAATAMASPAPA